MELEVRIDRLGAQGDGVAQGPEGPLFGPFALPGELVRLAPNPGTDRAEPLAIVEASRDRIAPVCRPEPSCKPRARLRRRQSTSRGGGGLEGREGGDGFPAIQEHAPGICAFLSMAATASPGSRLSIRSCSRRISSWSRLSSAEHSNLSGPV